MVISMGKVATIYRIIPQEGKTVEDIKNYLSDLNVADIKEVDIGFGIKALKVMIVSEDNEGNAKVEEKLSNEEMISSYEVEDTSLL